VAHALRVNDVMRRRPFLQFLGRSFHRRHSFALRQDQFLARRGVARFAEITSRLMHPICAHVRFFADDLPVSNSRTRSAAVRSQWAKCASKSFADHFGVTPQRSFVTQ
jgi:hypothetical protein